MPRNKRIPYLPPPDAASSVETGGMITGVAVPPAAASPATRRNRNAGSSPALPKETRALRYRSSCPAKLYERLERAETQRLYLVERTELGPEECQFAVLGSTGNVYDVHLCDIPTCTCPDFAKKQDLCKHVMFVTLKVIGLSKDDPLSYQRAYVPSELRHLVKLMRNRRVGGGAALPLANASVRRRYALVKRGDDVEEAEDTRKSACAPRRPLEDDSDCPICFDPLQGNAKSTESAALLTYCRGTCGTNFHADCIRAWKTRGTATTCPNCRQPWVEDDDKALANGGRTNTEGYVNLGRLQGQNPERDTSTYRQRWRPSECYKRRRYGLDDDDGEEGDF